MSSNLPKVSGLKPPSSSLSGTKMPRATGLPKPAAAGSATPNRALAMSRESLLSAGSCAADDWIVGDRCFVGGTKLGKVAFIGEVKFQPGDWAGVVLDEPGGKNDGSVNGVRYFQCAPNHGLFTKLSKLTRHPLAKPEPIIEPVTPGQRSVPPIAEAGDSFRVIFPIDEGEVPRNASSTPVTADAAYDFDETLRLGESAALSPISNQRFNLPTAASTPSSAETNGLQVGDKVIISGTKTGVVCYLGNFHLKEGIWAGVELDKPLGKNDGSVDGQRYFACRPMYGVFAPVQKVVRQAVIPGSGQPAPRIRHTVTSAMRAQKLSGSQESLSSISSFQSSASRPQQRVRLGVASLASPPPPFALPSTVAASAQKLLPASGRLGGSQAPHANLGPLQDSLHEKEQHVEQLIKERDLERAETARIVQQAELAEQTLSEFRFERERIAAETQLKLEHLQTALEQSQKECKELTLLFDEEKRRSEDLQFRVEEESILKGDMEARIQELEAKLKVAACGNSETASDTKLATHAEAVLQLEQLQKQHETARKKVADLESIIEEAGKREVELRERLLQMETRMEATIKDKDVVIGGLDMELKRYEDDVKDKECEIQKLGSNVNELTSSLQDLQHKLSESELSSRELHAKFERSEAFAKQQSDELAHLLSEKELLEHKMLANSGANSEQLKLIEDKNGEIAQLRLKLISNETENANLTAQISQLNAQVKSDKEIGEATAAAQSQRLLELEGQVKECCGKLEAAKVEQTRLHDDLTAKDSLLHNLASELEANRSVLVQSEDAKQKLQVEQDALKREVVALQEAQRLAAENVAKSVLEESAKITDLKATIEGSSKREAELRERLLETEAVLRDKDAVIGGLDGELKRYEENIKEKGLVVQKLDSSVKQVTSALQDLQLKFSESETSCRELNAKLEKSEVVVKQKGDELAQLLSEKKSLEQKMLANSGANSDQLKLIEDKNSEIAQLRSKLTSNETATADLIAQISQLTTQLKSEKVGAETVAAAQTQRLTELEAKITDNSSALDAAKAEQVRLHDDLTAKNSLLHKLSAELEANKGLLVQGEDAKKKLQAEHEALTQQIAALQEAQRLATESVAKSVTEGSDKITQLNQAMASQKAEHDKLLLAKEQLDKLNAKLSADLEQNKAELASVKALADKERQALLSEAESVGKSQSSEVDILKHQVESLTKELQTKDDQLKQSQDSVQQTASEVHALKDTVQKIHELEQQKTTLTKELSATKQREFEILTQFENERSQLKAKLEKAQMQIVDKEREIAELKRQSSVPLEEVAKAKAMETLELEKFELQERLLDLETRFQQLQVTDSADVKRSVKTASAGQVAGASSSASLECSNKSADVSVKTELSQQVEFLNSVIIDLKRKNDELQLKIDVLQRSSVDDLGIHNGIMKVPAPRSYCDICEVFDKHETEDCPSQSATASEENVNGHTQHHANRHAERPYCTSCERDVWYGRSKSKYSHELIALKF